MDNKTIHNDNDENIIVGGGVSLAPDKLKDYDAEIVITSSGVDLKTEYPDEVIDKITDIKIKYEPDFIRDQRPFGMCVSFATSGIIQALHKKETGEIKKKSAAWIYGLCRKTPTVNSDGMNDIVALDKLITYGDCNSEDFEMLGTAYDVWQAAQKTYDKYKDSAVDDKIKGYIRIDGCNKDETIRNIKRYLLKYQMPILIITDAFAGGLHAINDVGIKNNELWCMNSYGEDSGVNGYCKIERDNIKKAYFLIDDENMIIPFTDIPQTEWFFKPVKSVYYAGLMNGTDKNIFEPYKTLTRAEIAQIIYNLINKAKLGLSVVNNNVNFNDVASDKWYYKAIQDICSLGIMNGVSTTEFEPERGLTRTEMCQVILNFLDKSGYMNTLLDTRSSMMFTDVSIDSWYYNAVNKLYNLELINGVDENNFYPDKTLLRCEMAQVLYNLISKIDDLVN